MLKICDIADALEKAQDGIWYSPEEAKGVSYPADGKKHCFAVEEKSFGFKHRSTCIMEAATSFSSSDKGLTFDFGGGQYVLFSNVLRNKHRYCAIGRDVYEQRKD